MTLVVTIPGQPQPQRRPRFSRRGKGVHVHPDPKDVDWRGRVQVLMRDANGRDGPVCIGPSPLRVTILAAFRCTKGDERKRTPRPRRWCPRRNADCDNVLKAVLDAGNGVIWIDDAQVVDAHVQTIIAAQGEAPFTRVTVEPLGDYTP